jgi:outer membrane cobalamin receptor
MRVEYGSKWKVWYQWNREGKRFQDTANILEMPEQEYVTCGVSVSHGALSLSAEVRNLQDRDLFDIGGYPLPGRAVFATVEWRF